MEKPRALGLQLSQRLEGEVNERKVGYKKISHDKLESTLGTAPPQ